MTRTGSEYAVIPGVRFKATPYYSESHGLDGLARFFYDKVLPHIDDLERLRRLFDLPPRLVDEVLGDLVRLRYARLNVPARRIIRIPNAVPHPTFVAQPEEELWQDRLTGSVIRYRDVPSVYRGRGVGGDRAITLQPERANPGRDYKHVPGGRLAQMLRVTSPKMAILPNGAELETLLGCSHVADESLYIPFDSAMIDRRTVPFVRAPELPALLTRSWTRLLHRQLEGGGPVVAGSYLGQEDEDERRAPTLWEVARLSAQLSGYVQALVDLSTHRRTSELDGVKQSYRAQKATVVTRLESVAAVDLVPPQSPHASHMAELWAAAQHFLLIVVEGPGGAVARQLAETLGPVRGWRATVLVIEAEPAVCAAALPRDVSPDRLQCARSAAHARIGLCIRDGIELRIGTAGDLLSSRPLLRVLGGSLPSDLAVRISGAFAEAECMAFVQDLVQVGRAREARRGALEAGLSAELALADGLRRMVDDCDALVERVLPRARAAWAEAERSPANPGGVSDGTSKGAEKGIEPIDLRDLEPGLHRLESELTGWAAGPGLPAPLSTVYQPPITSPAEILAEAVRAVHIHRDLRSLLVSFDRFDDGGPGSGGNAGAGRTDPWAQLLRPALEAGCTVTLYLNPISEAKPTWDPASVAALGQLEKAVSHHLLRVRRGRIRIPVALVIDAALVVIGHRGWFQDGVDDDIFLAFDARHLADKLTAAD